nr:hypothetical protein [Tanacetum cinerariifolium]
MYHMYNEQIFCDYVVVRDMTQLFIEFQNNDSPSNIQEELGAANIEGNSDSDKFNLGDRLMADCSSTKKNKKDKNSNTRRAKLLSNVLQKEKKGDV